MKLEMTSWVQNPRLADGQVSTNDSEGETMGNEENWLSGWLAGLYPAAGRRRLVLRVLDPGLSFL